MNRIKKLLAKSTSVLSRKTDSIGLVAFGIGIILLLTKFAGLFKLQVLTAIYGVKSVELDLFNAANTIPEFIFTIIVIGGVNAALIPVLGQTSLNESAERLKKVFSSIVNVFFITLLIICSLVFVFAPQIVYFSTNLRLTNTQNSYSAADYQLFINLLRILIFSPIILSVSSIFSSILQVKRYFWSTTLAPLFYNLGIIGAALSLNYFDKNITVLAFGVLIASLLHFIVQLPAIIKAGIKYEPSINLQDLYVRKAIKFTIPRIISLASDYIGNIFQVLISLNLLTGSLNSFRIAISLRDLPSSMFGLSVAQAYFPEMTELAEKGEKHELQKTFSKAIRAILFWTIPISALFIVLRTPIVQLMFGLLSKNVDFSETNMISYSLLFLSFGIIIYSLLAIVNRLFFSINDSFTPTIISVLCIFMELILTYTLVNLFSHFDDSLSVNPAYVISNFHNYFENGNSPAAIGGVALSSSLTLGINLALLILSLKRKGYDFFYEVQYIMKKALSGLTSLIIGLLVFRSPLVNWFGLFDTEKVLGVFLTTLNGAIIISLTYYLMEKLLKDEDISILENAFSKGKRYFKRVFSLFRNNKIVGVGSGS